MKLKGISASKGIVKGRAKILNSTADMKKVEKGDILIVDITSPLYTPAILIAGGIVTNKGGILSHSAIIAREVNIPCVVGTENATICIKDNDLVIVDGDKGIVTINE